MRGIRIGAAFFVILAGILISRPSAAYMRSFQEAFLAEVPASFVGEKTEPSATQNFETEALRLGSRLFLALPVQQTEEKNEGAFKLYITSEKITRLYDQLISSLTD